MKGYLIITIIGTLACCWLMTENRTIVMTSNIKHIEGTVTIASSTPIALNKKWYNPIIQNQYLEINISK